MSDVTNTGPGANPPVPAARVEADAATARTNADVVRPDLAEARRVADQTLAERFIEQRDGRPQGDRIGDKKLSDAEYNSLTYSEKQAYAERRTELTNKAPDTSKPGEAPKPSETKIKLGENFEVTETEARGLMERAAIEESRKLTLPADPNGYKLKLPDDFVPPPGIEFKFDEKNPALQQAREFAHKNGFSQEQFSGMVAIHAAAEVANTQNLKTARDAEVAKLGATGSARVTAIETFLRGHLGDELAKPFRTTLVMETQVRGWEIIMQKLANAGAGSFSPPRAPHEPARISDAEYSSMSYSQQKAYAERMSGGSGRR